MDAINRMNRFLRKRGHLIYYFNHAHERIVKSANSTESSKFRPAVNPIAIGDMLASTLPL